MGVCGSCIYPGLRGIGTKWHVVDGWMALDVLDSGVHFSEFVSVLEFSIKEEMSGVIGKATIFLAIECIALEISDL